MNENPPAATTRIQDMQLRRVKLVAGLALTFCALASAQTQPATLHWQPWSDAAFTQARAEHKFVLLDLEAVWCHWCHVMDDVTYRDPTAAEAMRYLAADSVALRPLSAGILLANQDATETPIHVTILGSPSNPDGAALHAATLRSIASRELIEVRDPSNPSPLPTTVEYPHLNHAALFLCTARSCSSPIVRSEDVRAKLERAQLQVAP